MQKFNVSVANITSAVSQGGVLHFVLSPQVEPCSEKDAGQLLSGVEVLRSEPQGVQNITFALRATTLGDIEVTPRLTVAIPQHADSIEAKREAEKERRRKQEDFRRALGSLSSDGEGTATSSSAAAAVAAKESSAAATSAASGGGGRGRGAGGALAGLEKAVDEGWRSQWPDVYMEPYVIRAADMIEPLPMSEGEFSAIVWMRLHAADVVHYCVERCSEDMEMGAINDRLCTYGVYSVGQRVWGGGKCFEGAYAFVSWFDNVFALRLFVFEKRADDDKNNNDAGVKTKANRKFYVRAELRASSHRCLKVLSGNKLTEVLDTVFIGSTVKIDESNFHSLLN